ncbi:MAG: PLP-dependent aspartate aminotransferase family protein [Halobacteriaceae archaeon]
MDDADRNLETLTVGAGVEARRPDGWGDDVVPPIHLASTYELPGIGGEYAPDRADPGAGQYLYSRLGNPTRQAAERRLAAVSAGDRGFVFGSGMAAIATAVLATVGPGDHVVASRHLYAGTRSLLNSFVTEDLGAGVTDVDPRDPDAVADAVRPDTGLVWVESPTNPRLHLCDLAAVADRLADRDVAFGVDNTFATPHFQRPLSLGADLVVQSTTKYLNGHSDGLGGGLVTDDDALADRVARLQQEVLGNGMAPFDCYLLCRGMSTLHVRMDRHEQNAAAVADHLVDRDPVEAVHYPGLESHPQHDLAAAQMDGFGGMVTLELAGGLDAAARFVEALDVFTLAASLGGVESLVEVPAAISNAGVSAAERAALGITDGTVRLSVGLEAEADLLADLDAGLAAVTDGPA